MKRVRKIIEKFVVCNCQKPLLIFKKNIDIDDIADLKPGSIIKTSELDYQKIPKKCPMCHGTGLRVKKKIFFYPDDREF